MEIQLKYNNESDEHQHCSQSYRKINCDGVSLMDSIIRVLPANLSCLERYFHKPHDAPRCEEGSEKLRVLSRVRLTGRRVVWKNCELRVDSQMECVAGEGRNGSSDSRVVYEQRARGRTKCQSPTISDVRISGGVPKHRYVSSVQAPAGGESGGGLVNDSHVELLTFCLFLLTCGMVVYLDSAY